MEPRYEEQKTNEARPQQQKPKRFRIVQLEERIAPRASAPVPEGPSHLACNSMNICTVGACNVTNDCQP